MPPLPDQTGVASSKMDGIQNLKLYFLGMIKKGIFLPLLSTNLHQKVRSLLCLRWGKVMKFLRPEEGRLTD